MTHCNVGSCLAILEQKKKDIKEKTGEILIKSGV